MCLPTFLSDIVRVQSSHSQYTCQSIFQYPNAQFSIRLSKLPDVAGPWQPSVAISVPTTSPAAGSATLAHHYYGDRIPPPYPVPMEAYGSVPQAFPWDADPAYQPGTPTPLLRIACAWLVTMAGIGSNYPSCSKTSWRLFFLLLLFLPPAS